jgi:hypothetical protein
VLYMLDILDTRRHTKCVTSRYGKCHNIKENEIGVSFTILSRRRTQITKRSGLLQSFVVHDSDRQ